MKTLNFDETVRAHFEATYRPEQLRFKSKNTLKKYRIELDRLDRFLVSAAAVTIEREAGPARLCDLTDAIIGDCAEWLLQSGRTDHGGRSRHKGLSVESVRGFVGRMRKLWDFLARKRLVEQFPTVPNLQKEKRIPRAWSRRELAILYQAVSRLRGDIGGIEAGEWWTSFLTVMWRTGERPEALLSVRWDWLDFNAMPGWAWLSIPAAARKGRRQPRAYRLTPDCVEWLERIRLPSRDMVWPWPHHYSTLFRRYKEILRRANLSVDRNSMFSRIRCSHASHLEAAGGDATESLGHQGRQTTRDHYLDETIVRRDWPADKLFPLDDVSGLILARSQ